MGGKSSGRPSGPQEVTQTSTNLPEYAEPYFRRALERTAYETMRPYEAFPGQRIADFTPEERMSMQGMTEMAAAGTPYQMRQASDIASRVGYQPVGQGLSMAREFQPQDVISQYSGPDIDPGYQAGDISQGYQAGQRTAGYTGRPGEQYHAMGMPGGVSPAVMPDGGQFQFPPQEGQFGPGFTPGTVADPETIQSYMSPYQQMVTDVEKREARRQSDIMGSQMGQQAAQAGGLGGYREAIMQAERERNLGQQLGDIQTRGSQAGFQQAQQAFEADRAARLQAGQLGLQMGGAREQALQAGERFGQQQFMTNEQLRQQQQQANLGVYQAGESARQQAGRMGMSAQEIEDRGRQAENQARMGAQQFNIQQQRAAAELGIRGLGFDQATRDQQLRAAQQLGGYGSQEQQMAYQRLQNMQAAGEMQRQLSQQGLTMGYQDFLRQQAYPREQISFYNQILRGLPIQPGQTQATFGGPSSLERMLGSGIAGVGLYKALR